MTFTISILFLLFQITFGQYQHLYLKGDDFDMQYIINGTDAEPGEAPYMASIIRYEQDVFCGGVVISDRHVLTASHCASKYSASNLSLIIGTNNLLEGGVYVHVQKIALSDDYNAAGTIGIAVLTLSEPLTFSDSIKKVELPTSDVADNTYVKFTGYGFRIKDKENGYMSEILQKLESKIVNQQNCTIALAPYETVLPQHLCAFAGVARGPCWGDSGSPLVINNTVVGIALSVYPNCAEGLPDLYARITHYTNFIKQTISS